MSSKLIHRSCGSSIRTLINCHLRPTVAATTIQTEPPVSIYNWHYLLPTSLVPKPVNIGYGFGRDVTEYSVFEAAKSKYVEESIVDEDDDDDDDDDEYSASDLDDDYDSGDDDHMGTDDD